MIGPAERATPRSTGGSRWRRGLTAGLLACLSACSEGSEPPPTGVDAPRPVRGSDKLDAAPRPASLEDLDPAAAESILRATDDVDANVDTAPAWLVLGMLYHANGRLDTARTCYRQCVLREDLARGWYYLAVVEDQLGGIDKALLYLGHVAELEPRYVPARWRLGQLHLDRGELDEAEAALQAALAIAPHDPASVVGMSRVDLQRGRPAAAVARLEGHLARFPDDDNARFLLGSAYRDAGRMEEASRALAAGTGGDPLRDDPWYAEVLSYREGYRTEFLNAVELLDRGRHDEAIEALEALLRREPEDTLVHINLHRAYRMTGQLDRAIDLLLEARRIDPARDQIHFHLAGSFHAKAREAGEAPDPALLRLALESADEACELSPTFAAAHALRGDVLLDLERYREAAEAFVRAAELDRSEPLWQQKAGFTLVRFGQWEASLPFLRRLEVLQPDSVLALQMLGTALANAGHLDEARTTLERAQGLDPGNAEIAEALRSLTRAEADGQGGGGG